MEHNWLYKVVHCYNYHEVEEYDPYTGEPIKYWDWDTDESYEIYGEIDYYYDTVVRYANEIAYDTYQKIRQLVGNPPSNTGKPAITIEKLNGEVINTELAIFGFGKDIAGAERVAVKTVQAKLNEVIDAGLRVDGSFGSNTSGAVQNLQLDKLKIFKW